MIQTTRWYVFHEGAVLLQQQSTGYTIYTGDKAPILEGSEQQHVVVDTPAVRCIAYTTQQEEAPEGFLWIGLRQSYYYLSPELYQQAGKAFELMHFDHTHRFCGYCGAPMQWHSLISKQCTGCGREIWPQINGAIIVLIHKGDEALLVQARNFKRNFFGLVAGFVETGETLEECVHREVREETSLEVTNIRYFASQPWPYPSGLMIGFEADYVSGELRLADGELRQAGFFSRDNLPTLPEKLSMARMLIDHWLEEK